MAEEMNQDPHSPQQRAAPVEHPTGFAQPRPLTLLPPSIWPFVAAVGLTAFFWGFLTTFVVLSAGFAVFALGMAGMIGDWVREHRSE